ncbi:MAG: prefoldin subunit [Candidatus Nanoarchaeia archaeon]|jgi:prefoldin beta subunit|nr:prefoldin subunit [Candidatus Nanoarchaeia archaeon]
MNEELIQKLSIVEQNLSSIISQKQLIQKQIFEANNAIEELNKVDTAYKIVGQVMLKKSSKELIKSLESEKEISTVRMSTIEKQEKTLREQMDSLQKQLLSQMKN